MIRIWPHLLYLTCCCFLCSLSCSRSATYETSKISRPSVAETGGEATEVYFEYCLRGGISLSVVQVLGVSSSQRLSNEAYRNLANVPAYFPEWREVYYTDEQTTQSIVSAIERSGFFDWESMNDAAATDGFSWTMLVRIGDRRHKARISYETEEVRRVIDDYYDGRTIRRNDDDSGLQTLAKNFLQLLDEVRRIAAERGTPVGPVEREAK